MRLVAPLALALLSSLSLGACTTVHQVALGPEPGEFYAVTSQSFLGLPGPSYVLRCVESGDPVGANLHCTRVLSNKEAAQLSPLKSPDGAETLVRPLIEMEPAESSSGSSDSSGSSGSTAPRPKVPR